MKLRKGFVSNSSSASFVVTLPPDDCRIIDCPNCPHHDGSMCDYVPEKVGFFRRICNWFISNNDEIFTFGLSGLLILFYVIWVFI